jgi:hypothetical protein
MPPQSARLSNSAPFPQATKRGQLRVKREENIARGMRTTHLDGLRVKHDLAGRATSVPPLNHWKVIRSRVS